MSTDSFCCPRSGWISVSNDVEGRGLNYNAHGKIHSLSTPDLF